MNATEGVDAGSPARAKQVKDPVAQMDRAVASYPHVASSSLAGVTTSPVTFG